MNSPVEVATEHEIVVQRFKLMHLAQDVARADLEELLHVSGPEALQFRGLGVGAALAALSSSEESGFQASRRFGDVFVDRRPYDNHIFRDFAPKFDGTTRLHTRGTGRVLRRTDDVWDAKFIDQYFTPASAPKQLTTHVEEQGHADRKGLVNTPSPPHQRGGRQRKTTQSRDEKTVGIAGMGVIPTMTIPQRASAGNNKSITGSRSHQAEVIHDELHHAPTRPPANVPRTVPENIVSLAANILLNRLPTPSLPQQPSASVAVQTTANDTTSDVKGAIPEPVTREPMTVAEAAIQTSAASSPLRPQNGVTELSTTATATVETSGAYATPALCVERSTSPLVVNVAESSSSPLLVLQGLPAEGGAVSGAPTRSTKPPRSVTFHTEPARPHSAPDAINTVSMAAPSPTSSSMTASTARYAPAPSATADVPQWVKDAHSTLEAILSEQDVVVQKHSAHKANDAVPMATSEKAVSRPLLDNAVHQDVNIHQAARDVTRMLSEVDTARHASPSSPSSASTKTRSVRRGGKLSSAVVDRIVAFQREEIECIRYNERLWNTSHVSQFVFADRLTASLLGDLLNEVMDEVTSTLDEYVEGLAEHELQ